MHILKIPSKNGKVYSYVIKTRYTNIRWTQDMKDEFTKLYLDMSIPIIEIGNRFGITDNNVRAKARYMGIYIKNREHIVQSSK